MAWLRKVAGSALRGAGNVLAVHVVPDSLIPSWKTRQYLSTATRAASRLGSTGKGKKKKKAAPSSPRSGSPPSRRPPSSRAAFNKNAWGRGASLPSAPAFSLPPSTSRQRSGASPSFSQMVQKRQQQLRDFRNHPRLVVQMHLDELLHHVKTYKPSNSKQRHPN